MESNQILALVIIFALVLILPAVISLSKHLGAKSDNERKKEPYESGVRLTHKDPYDTFNVKFFLVGLIFLLFDIEILFMLPWAINLEELGFYGLIKMFIFMGLLIAGLVQVYKSGVLKWT